MPSKRTRKPATPAKRPQGRPRRSPDLVRLTVYIPGDLKRWLRHQAIDTGKDMGQLVAAAVAAMRTQQDRRQ